MKVLENFDPKSVQLSGMIHNTKSNMSVSFFHFSVQHPAETCKRDGKNSNFSEKQNKNNSDLMQDFCVFLSGVPAGQRHHQGHQQDVSGS